MKPCSSLPCPAARRPRRRGQELAAGLGLLALVLAAPAAAQTAPAPAPAEGLASVPVHRFVLPEGLTEAQKARFARFQNFQIKGVCGTKEDFPRLAALGVNTYRTYSIKDPATTLQTLETARRVGMYVIVSEWLPNQGKNRGNWGGTYDFDYEMKSEELFQKFMAKVEGIGDHPALLMWGLGNEVHLDGQYLTLVNRMSIAIHDRFPLHLTSLTMINAKPENIAKVKEFAPDLDVLGVQSYSPGAVKGSIRNAEEHWGRPFYVSEFNGKGPWNFKNTAWGEPLDEPVTVKVRDVWDCYRSINSSSMCLGGTIFAWGHTGVGRPTYFSLLLDRHPDGEAEIGKMLLTPQADVMAEVFTRQPVKGNRAPILSGMKFADGSNARQVKPGDSVTVALTATDADGDKVQFAAWLLDTSARRSKTAAGPIKANAEGVCEFRAPRKAGKYVVMCYALDGQGGASASTVALLVGDLPPAAPKD